MTDIPMDIALGEGIRRLPVYLLLDCSGSMAGAPIQAVQRGGRAISPGGAERSLRP